MIIILGFGLIGAISEYSLYQNKEQTNYNELQEKSETAAIALANSPWSDCNFGTTHIAYSINTEKINLNVLDTSDLKKRLGVSDLNVQINLSSGNSIKFPTTAFSANNVAVIDLNVLWCNNNTRFSDMNKCITTDETSCNSPNIGRAKLTIKVGK